MSYTVIFTPEAQEQLVTIYQYIETNASPTTAERYTGAILDYCEGLVMFPDVARCVKTFDRDYG